MKFSFLKKLLHFAQNHPLLIICCYGLLFLISAWGLQFSRFELDIYDSYDSNFASSIDLRDMKENYDDHTQLLVHFSFKNNPKAKEICDLLKWSREVSRSKDISNVSSLWSLRAPELDGDRLWYKKILKDPCEMSSEEEIIFEEKFYSAHFRHLTANTGSRDLIFDVTFSDEKLDVKKVEKLISSTDDFIARHVPSARARYLGLAGFRYYFKKIMGQDQFASMLVIFIIFGFLRLLYGTWKSGFLLVLTLIITNVILYGLMGLFRIPVDILTNNLFLMTAVSSTADFIFVTQYQLEGEYQDSLDDLVIPCFFTTLTTIVGFLSLNTSDLEIIKRFGTGAAMGAFLEWAMLFQLIPAILKSMKKDKIWVNSSKARGKKWLKKIEDFALPPIFLKLLIFLMILAIPSIFFLNDQDSPVRNLPEGHVLRESYEEFTKKFDWQGQVYLYFPEVPNKNEYQRIVSEVSQHSLVVKIENPEEIADEWARGYPQLKQDLIKRELSMSPLWEKYYSDAGTLRMSLYLKEQDLKTMRTLRDFVRGVCRGQCRLAGQRVVYLEYGERISVTLIESFGLSILIVSFILGLLLWSVGKMQHLWPVVISSLMGPLVILSLMALFQIEVTVITSIFLAIMVGLAGDNAIQYLMTRDKNLVAGIESRARASIIVTIVMILSSAIFLVQSLRPMKILGMLFILGFTVNLVGDLFGLKGLLTKQKLD
jgi:predicted RND superfamily exporter protein